MTFCGIVVNFTRDGSNYVGSSIALTGVIITCCGHWVAILLSRHQKSEKEADNARIEELEDMVLQVEDANNDPHLKRLIQREKSEFEVAHQDDGL